MFSMFASWSPSCLKFLSEYDLTRVSFLTCPEIMIIGMESVNAPNTPFKALIPPGPLVTLTTAGLF